MTLKSQKNDFHIVIPPNVAVISDNEIKDPNSDSLCQEFSETTSDKMFFDLITHCLADSEDPTTGKQIALSQGSGQII